MCPVILTKQSYTCLCLNKVLVHILFDYTTLTLPQRCFDVPKLK